MEKKRHKNNRSERTGEANLVAPSSRPSQVLASRVAIQAHFARSANLERDHGQPINDYLPTARARDVLRRVVNGVERPQTGRAFSITGTYGTGKSSLALFLDAILGYPSLAQDSADEVLSAVDPDLHRAVVTARSSMPGGALLCAAATAEREPVSTTLLRALRNAVEQLPDRHRSSAAAQRILAASPGPDLEILSLLDGLAREHAMLLIIDEFGKNLEEFAATKTRDADLFVLQSIAEWVTDTRHHPVVLLTLQHLAFTEYDADGSRGREWSKIQGRFVDIPYVDTPAETQALIASVHSTTSLPEVADWAASCSKELDQIGVADLLHVDPAEMYPLHPTLAAALAPLCSRYGQNERTLFSFLAGPDAHAVPSLLASTPLPARGPLPSVRLHHAYDFFLTSAATAVGASPHASRWIEIESRLRDTVGLTESELKVLKAIGVLNLIATGGSLRASRRLVRAAVLDGQRGTGSAEAVDKVLDSLETSGLVTYREFADEYRIWSGSDYDLQGGIDLARRRVLAEPLGTVLNRVRPQVPVVAARHSQEFGVLRVFARHFVDSTGTVPPLDGQEYDGMVLLATDSAYNPALLPAMGEAAEQKPVVVGIADAESLKALVDAAHDLAAHQLALREAQSAAVDWVARRELGERSAAAAARLDAAIEAAYGVGSVNVRWYDISGPGKSGAHLINSPTERSMGARTLSSVLSDVCDQRYPLTPRLKNEMLSRRSLTSQGAKARRDLLQAMIERADEPRCGIEGYGPERAMYEAVLARTGIHRRGTLGWHLGAPHDGADGLGYGPSWQSIVDAIERSAGQPLSVRDLYVRLMAPPIGLKEGPIPVLLTAVLLESANSVAIYENGTFLTRLDTPAIERLIRNPELFTLRYYRTTGSRTALTGRLAQSLGTRSFGAGQRVGAIVGIAGVLLGRARALPFFSQRTRRLSPQAKAVRTALFSASDPEALLFEALPEAVGAAGVDGQTLRADDVESFVDALVSALDELSSLYPSLRDGLISLIGAELAAEGDVGQVRKEVRRRFGGLRRTPLESSLQTFLHALVDDALDDHGWAEYVCMLLLNKPPESWTDEDADSARTRAVRVCRQLRHVESIHFDRQQGASTSEGKTALRVGVTRADGEDISRVVHVDDEALEAVDAVVSRALRDVQARVGSAGREALLARLAEAVLSDKEEQNATKRSGSSRGSDSMSTNVRNGSQSKGGKTA